MIVEENLLENIRKQGAYLEKLLREGLQGPNSLAAPVTFDIRGGGGFWGIEFDTEGQKYNLKEPLGMLVQARCLENGLVIIGQSGGSNVEGTKGSHAMLAPAYNVTKEEIEIIAEKFIRSVEEILRESNI